MPRLQLVFNCLNLFVADTDNDVVHVLMPSTRGHGEKHRHEVRLAHSSFEGDAKTEGKRMDGWALELGKNPRSEKGTAKTSLVPAQPSPLDDVVVDIGTITGRRVSRELVRDSFHQQVAARVSLYGGRVTRLQAEAEFLIKGKSFVMAHQVTWEMLSVTHELKWVKLDAAAPAKPLRSLRELTPEANLGFRLEINHVTHDSLLGRSGDLTADDLAMHFAMLYPLLGITRPSSELLPQIVGRTDGVRCVGAMARLEPTGSGN